MPDYNTMTGLVLDFAACTLAIHPEERIETRFKEDGSVSLMWVPDLIGKEDHLAATRHCGYGDDQWRMAVEHEIGHAFVADKLGWPHSWSVWSAAHGTGQPGKPWSRRVTDEECLVVALQRYRNTGELDPDGYLIGHWQDEIQTIGLEFIKLCVTALPSDHSQP